MVIRGLIATTTLALAACSTQPANDDPNGFACGAAGECSPEFACDKARSVCVASSACHVGPDGFCQACGDGVTTGTEACDDGRESKRCNVDCTLSACGDGIINATAGEQCDDESFNSATAADACRAVTCALPRCGDGVVDTGEACDDANTLAGDGCSATCATEAGWLCRGSASHCWQQLVAGVNVWTTPGPLASLFVDFTEAVSDKLSDGVTPATGVGRELFAVETDDRLGNRVPVGLAQVAFTRKDGKPCTLGHTGATGCDRALLTVAAAASDCSTALTLLRFDTAYRVRVSSRLRAADGAPAANLPADGDVEVATPAPPHLTSLTTSNGVTRCDLFTGTCDKKLAEGDRVPVNASINLRFSDPMEPSSLVASATPDPAHDTVLLHDLDDDCHVPILVTMTASDLFHVLPATTGPQDCGGSSLASTLAFDARFELTIAGRRAARPGAPGCSTNGDGYAEVCGADGRYLPDDVVVRFRTSSANQLAASGAVPCDQPLQLRSSRPVAAPGGAGLTLTVGTASLAGAEQATPGERWVTALLSPSACASAGPATLRIEGPTDALGNPFVATTSTVQLITTSPGTPQLAGVAPARAAGSPLGTCGSDLVLPADTTAASAVAGSAGVTLFTAAGTASRPLVRTAASGLVLEDITTGTPRALAFDVDAQLSPDLLTADALYVTPRAPFKAGRRYRFYATTRLTAATGAAFPCAALATQLPLVLEGRRCAPGGTCAPALLGSTPVADAQGVASTATVVLTFDQPIDPASVVDPATGAPTGNLQLRGPDGAAVPGTFVFTGSRWYDGAAAADTAAQPGFGYTKVTFTPTRPLKAGRHELGIVDATDAAAAGRPCKDPTTAALEPSEPARALTDAAGNCLRKAGDVAFTVEGTPPWIAALTASSAPDRVVVRFAEPVDDTLAPSSLVVRSGISCFDNAAQSTCMALEGSVTGARCADSHTCDTAVLTPALPFGWFNRGASAAWTVVTGAPPPTDLGGTALSTTTGPVPLNGVVNTFVPTSTEARLLCTDPPHDPTAVHPVLETQGVTLTFSHPVQRASVAKLVAENACTGETLPLGVTPETDGSQYTLLPTTGSWPAGAIIALTVGQTVVDAASHPLALATQVRFKVGSPGLCR